MNPIVRVLPHLTDAASLPDCAAGAAARSGVAYAPATIASAAPSASKAAIADALLLIRFLLECLPRSSPTCDADRAYLLSGYERFAGLPAGWNTPRIRMGPDPLFSMQCSSSGGRWKQEPAWSGKERPPTCAAPSPETMYPTSSYLWLWKGALLGWTMPMNWVTSKHPASSFTRYRKVRSLEASSSGWSANRTVTLRSPLAASRSSGARTERTCRSSWLVFSTA